MSRRAKVTLTVSVGVFMASLDLFIVNIAFPAIRRDFDGTSLASLSWVLNAYGIVFAALLVPAGRWADRSGRKRGFLAGLAVFTLASAACAAAPSVTVLVLSRAFQAAGAALLIPTSLGLANLGALLFFTAFGALLLGSVLFLTSVWHESVLVAGLHVAPGPAMAATFAFPGGILGQRYGQRFVGAAGALLFAGGALWFWTHMGTAPHYTSQMLPAQLLTGAGVGLILPTLSAAATGPLPPARFATGTAVLGMSRQLGSALGVAVLVAIIGHPGPAGVIAAFRDGWTFIIVLALAAGTALFSVGPVTIGGLEAVAMPPAAPESSPA